MIPIIAFFLQNVNRVDKIKPPPRRKTLIKQVWKGKINVESGEAYDVNVPSIDPMYVDSWRMNLQYNLTLYSIVNIIYTFFIFHFKTHNIHKWHHVEHYNW